jgi:hypothetical protein
VYVGKVNVMMLREPVVDLLKNIVSWRGVAPSRHDKAAPWRNGDTISARCEGLLRSLTLARNDVR